MYRTSHNQVDENFIHLNHKLVWVRTLKKKNEVINKQFRVCFVKLFVQSLNLKKKIVEKV